MTKSEFLKKLGELKRSTPYYKGDYSSEHDKDYAFKECKEKVVELALQLDEQGLTIEAYRLFREQTNDLTALHSELLKLQHELFEAQKEIYRLKQEIAKPPIGEPN